MILLVLGYVLIFVTVLAMLGVVRIALSGARSQRYLAESGEDAPLAMEHLPPALRRLVADTRILRVSLEGPVRMVTELRSGALDRRVEDPDVFERTLMDVEREVTEWLRNLEDAAGRHPEPFEDAGIDVAEVRALIDDGNAMFQRDRLLAPDEVALSRLTRLLEVMRRIEDALQRPGRLYR